MTAKKYNIQELILSALSRKKALRKRDLHKQVDKIIGTEKDSAKAKYAVNRALKSMVKNDVVEQHDTEQSSFLSLTAQGRQKLRNIKLNSKNHLVSTHWDGYWRIVVVDIPDSRKKEQDAFRYILKKAQFVQLKASVWISPFPLEHMLINMKKDLQLQEELMIFVTDKLDPGTHDLLQNKFMQQKNEE
jgi:DNA-binding transcriptional regulator PaaX